MRFVNKRLMGLAILMAVLLGLETPFNAATYAFIFTIIGGKHLAWSLTCVYCGRKVCFSICAICICK